MRRCRDNFLYWMRGYVYFLCKNQGHRKWEAWPIHERIADAIEQSNRLIILKSRQLGVSWQVAAYALWTAAFHTAQKGLLLSQGEDEAQELLGKCRYIYQHMPEWMKPVLSTDNQSELIFGNLDSVIVALPATQKAGRSEGTNLVVCDEWAFHPYAETNWAAVQPTLADNAKFIGISTANGRGNFFGQMWNGAQNKNNGFASLFLSCWDAPGRDPVWYAQQVREYAATPHLLAQEHPRNAAEAFLSSGYCLFDTHAIDTALKGCRPPIETRLNGLLRIWQRPEPGRVYCAGADVAEGLDAGNDRLDYSGAAVLDARTGMHVADLHGQWPLDVFTRHLRDLCTEYNGCLVGVERNNHGHAVLQLMLNSDALRYSNIYYHEEIQAAITNRSQPTKRKVAGWPTTAKTKPLMEQGLAAAIVSGRLTSYDEAFWDECLSYVQHGDGKTGAQQGTHDDRVIKMGIALQMMGQPGNVRSMPLTQDFRFAG